MSNNCKKRGMSKENTMDTCMRVQLAQAAEDDACKMCKKDDRDKKMPTWEADCPEELQACIEDADVDMEDDFAAYGCLVREAAASDDRRCGGVLTSRHLHIGDRRWQRPPGPGTHKRRSRPPYRHQHPRCTLGAPRG